LPCPRFCVYGRRVVMGSNGYTILDVVIEAHVRGVDGSHLTTLHFGAFPHTHQKP
jgi:hypothetical protein